MKTAVLLIASIIGLAVAAAHAGETAIPGVITQNVSGCTTEQSLLGVAAVEGKGVAAWNKYASAHPECKAFYATMLVKIVARDEARHMVQVDTTGYALHIYADGGYTIEVTGRGRERVWVAARVVTALARDLSPT